MTRTTVIESRPGGYEDSHEKTMILRTKEGKKLYPVCNWNENQHKLFYWENKAYLNDDYDERDRLMELIEVFNAGVHKDGLVYTEWKYNQPIKEAIMMYDLLH